jgi:stage V sporulation protein B
LVHPLSLIRKALNIRAVRHMLVSRRRVMQALIGTVSAGILMQATLVVTGIIVARALGPEDRGHFALLTLVVTIFGVLGPLGIPIGLNYSIARVPNRAADVIRRLRRPAVVRGIGATVLAAVLLHVLTRGRPDYVQAGALVVIVTVPATIVFMFSLNALAGLQRFAPFNFYRVAPNATFALVAPALLLTGKAGFIEIALAWTITFTVFAPLILRSAWRHAETAQTGEGEIPSTSWMSRFGMRGFFATESSVESYRVDQAVVALFLSPVALGLYVVALAFTNLPRFIAQAVGQVAAPTVASRGTRDQARRTTWRFFWFAVPIYLPVIVGLWLLAPQLTLFFFGQEFADAAPLIRLLLIATALYCARRVLTDGARGAGYPGLGTIAEIVALVSVLPLFAAFVPLWETRGVAYALIGSSAIALSVMVVGLLRPSARHAQAGASWFEILSPAEAPVDLDADASDAHQSAGEPGSPSM